MPTSSCEKVGPTRLHPLRTRVLPAVAFLVVLAACGDDDADGASTESSSTTEAISDSEPAAAPDDPGDLDDPEDGASSTTTAAVELTDSFRGVTADTIKVGVTYMDLEAVGDLIDLDYGDFEATYGAIIDAVNADGGVLGRQLDVEYAPYFPVGSDSMEEGCNRLTLDEQIFAAMGPLLFEGPLCYTEFNDTILVGPGQNVERVARSIAAWFSSTANLDQLVETVLRGFADEGVYDGATIAVVGNTADQSVLDNVVEPTLEELGVTIAETALITSALGDSLNGDPEVALIAERFRSAGADTVLALPSGSLQWATGLALTAYRPVTAFIDLQGVRAYLGDTVGRDETVFEGSVAGAHNQWYRWLEDPLIQECVDIVEDATDITIVDPLTAGPDDPDNIVALQWACSDIRLFVALAEAAGPDLTNATFRAAGESLGSFDIPGFGEGTYTPDSPDGDPPIYYWTWDSEAGIHVTDGTVFS